MEEIMKIIREALEAAENVESYDDITGEPGTIGVATADAQLFFVKVEPA